MSSPWGMDSSERRVPALPCWATKPGDPVRCTTELVCSEMHGAAARGEALSLLLQLPLLSWGLRSTLGARCVWCWSPRQRSGPLLRVPEDIPGVGNEVGALGSGTFLTFCPQTSHRLHLSPSLPGSLRSPHPQTARGEVEKTRGRCQAQAAAGVWKLQEIAGLCPHAPGCSGVSLWATLFGLSLVPERSPGAARSAMC